MPSLLVAGVGAVVLVVLLLVAGRSVGRFMRARAALQERVTQRVMVLHALWQARRPPSG